MNGAADLALPSGRFVAGGQALRRNLFGAPQYGALLADPPWQFSTWSSKGRGRSPDWVEREEALPLLGVDGSESAPKHYPTMPLEQIEALPIGDFAAPDSVLFLWAVLNMIPEALRVAGAWGFQPKTARIWAKTRVGGFDPSLSLDQNFPMGTGYIVRGNPEMLLICTRGKPVFRHKPRALIISPRLREHSRKPEIVRRDIERQVAGPYLELFARRAAPGWDAWGNQVDHFQEPAR